MGGNAEMCETRLQGSEAWQYCRRRLRVKMLMQTLPTSLQTWHTDGPSTPLFAAAAQAAENLIGGMTAESDFADAATHVGPDGLPRVDLEEATAERDANARPVQDRLHIPGDLMDLLDTRPRPWRCGPLVFFDRFDHIAANPPYDIDLTVQVCSGPSSADSDANSADSDDEETPETYTYPAALSQWDCTRLDAMQRSVVGKHILVPPNNDRMALEPISCDADGNDGIMLIERGSNTFADKATNAAAAGAAGCLISDNQEQPLFRMVGASEAEMKNLLPSML